MTAKNDSDFLRKLLDGTFESEFEEREKELVEDNQLNQGLGKELEKNDNENYNLGIEIGEKDQMTRLSVSLSETEKADVDRLIAESAEQGIQINKSEIIRIAIGSIKNISVEELIREYKLLKKNRAGRPYKNISG